MKTLLLALLLSPNAFGWGAFGHRVIGALAERRLCKEAAEHARATLGGQSLSEASTWADEKRTDPAYRYMKPWHYVGMPFGSHYEDDRHDPRGDVVTAVASALERLRANETAAEGLRMLIHFVGDAHQPLHAGRHEDGGGNAVDVTWFGKDDSLHHVWDTGLPTKSGLTVEALAAELDADHGEVALARPADWVDESSALAPTVYPESPRLGDEYVRKFLPVAKRRLFEAGVRLATLLNREWCSTK